MWGLIYKDLVLQKRTFISLLAAEILLGLMTMAPLLISPSDSENSEITEMLLLFMSLIFYFFMFLVWGMSIGGIFETDEIKKWAAFISSTPLTLKGQIGAKYMFTFISYILLSNLCTFFGYLSYSLAEEKPLIVNTELLLWIFLLFHAIEFPFMIRFGCRKGGMVKTVMGVLLVLFVFEYFLFGNTEMFGSTDKLWEFMLSLSDTSGISDAVYFAVGSVPFVSLVLYYISYRISCRLYLKGAQGYAK